MIYEYIALMCLDIYLIFYLHGTIWERKRWNNGICPDNDEPWILQDKNTMQTDCLYRAGDVTEWFNCFGYGRNTKY